MAHCHSKTVDLPNFAFLEGSAGLFYWFTCT